jgi:hypothetical protein
MRVGQGHPGLAALPINSTARRRHRRTSRQESDPSRRPRLRAALRQRASGRALNAALTLKLQELCSSLRIVDRYEGHIDRRASENNRANKSRQGHRAPPMTSTTPDQASCSSSRAVSGRWRPWFASSRRSPAAGVRLLSLSICWALSSMPSAAVFCSTRETRLVPGIGRCRCPGRVARPTCLGRRPSQSRQRPATFTWTMQLRVQPLLGQCRLHLDRTPPSAVSSS